MENQHRPGTPLNAKDAYSTYASLDSITAAGLDKVPTVLDEIGPDAARPLIAFGALMGFLNCHGDDGRAQQEFERVWQQIKDSDVLVPSVGAEKTVNA